METTTRMRTELVAEMVGAAGVTGPAEADPQVETRVAEAPMGTSRRKMPPPFWPFSAP